jgi:hypothetical protein
MIGALSLTPTKDMTMPYSISSTRNKKFPKSSIGATIFPKWNPYLARIFASSCNCIFSTSRFQYTYGFSPPVQTMDENKQKQRFNNY